VEPSDIGTTGIGGGGSRSGGSSGSWQFRGRLNSWLAGEGGRKYKGTPKSGEGPHSSEGEAAELVKVTSMPTPEALAAVLVCEYEEALCEVAPSVLEVNEAKQDCIRQDLHGEVDHSIKNIPQRAVHTVGRLHAHGHVGGQPAN
jgi:hypothetical protein